MARKKNDIIKVDQHTVPASLTVSNPYEYPLVYSDDTWDVVASGTALADVMGSFGQYDQHSINEALAGSGSGGSLQQDMKVTVDVGGITTKPTYVAGTSIESILRALLSPYVAFDYSVTTTAAAGTFEYGTAKTVTKFTITLTDGSIAPTKLDIGTTLDDDDLASVTNPTSGDVTLSESVALSGLSSTTFYLKMVDGTSTVRKTVSFNFPYYTYYGASSSTTAPTSSSGLTGKQSSSSESPTFSGDAYVWYLTPTTKTSIQQNIMGQWVNIDTVAVGAVASFTNSQGVTIPNTYYAYRSSKLYEAGSNMTFKIV